LAHVEGVTIAEAGNELAFLVNRHVRKAGSQAGWRPLRLALPWKYGFKSVKSIVHFSFSEKRPVSFWETVQGSEYGFWANVNLRCRTPVGVRRPSGVLGTNERVPTLQ